MDSKDESGAMLFAPGAGSSAANASFPPVDDHLVQPEVSREEIVRGRKIVTMGANPQHAALYGARAV